MENALKERDRLTKKAGGLKQERDGKGWRSKWMEIRDYISPNDGQFEGDEQNDGKRKDRRIINPAAIEASNVLASGMASGMTSQARPWFELSVPEGTPKTTNVIRWLYAVQTAIRDTLAKSNLYNVLPIVYKSEGTYGIAAMSALPDKDDVVRFYHYPVGTFCVATNSRGQVDTFYRCFKMQPRQMAQQFGINNLSAQVRKQAENGDQCWVTVHHMIEPNPDYDMIEYGTTRFSALAMPYRSTYWEDNVGGGNQGILSRGGFRRFPIMAPRWDVNGNNVYGTGPGDIALGKAKELQKLESDKLRMVALMANPSVTAPVSLRGQRATTVPGDITYVRDDLVGIGFKPTYVPSDNAIAQVRGEINECSNDIDDVFYKSLFLMLSQSDGTMTAYEVAQRKEEKMLMLGPVVERNNDELLDPLIDAVFQILVDNSEPYWMGLKEGEPPIPPPPEELAGVELRVEYISILAQAQKSVAVGSIERALQFTGATMNINPAAADAINIDVAQQEYYAAIGVPPTMLRGADEIAAIRVGRQQEVQQQQAMEQAAQLADSAKTLAETPVGGNTALTNLVSAANQ